MPHAPAAPPDDAEPQALLDALAAVLRPLAALAVARGVSHAELEELLKQAMVQVAADAHPQLPPHRSVSRIATATGINRREVTRLTQPTAAAPRVPSRSVASEVFTHWLGDRRYRETRGPNKGEPKVLPRLGPGLSFESLAQAVTRDVHPRSLLDELLRLNLAAFNAETDTVALKREGFVPSGDRVRMLGFLADNVGDHLHAAVDNVLGQGRSHFEQAVYADGLSAESLLAVRKLVGAQWKLLLEALVPPLEARVAADAGLPPADQRRVRIGLYGYDEPTPEAHAARKAAGLPPTAAPRRRPRRK